MMTSAGYKKGSSSRKLKEPYTPISRFQSNEKRLFAYAPSLADVVRFQGGKSSDWAGDLSRAFPHMACSGEHGERTAFTAAGPFGNFTRFLFDRDECLEPPWIFRCDRCASGAHSSIFLHNLTALGLYCKEETMNAEYLVD